MRRPRLPALQGLGRRLGRRTELTDDLRLPEDVVVLLALGMGLAGALWGALYLASGLAAAAVAPFGYTALTGANLLAYRLGTPYRAVVAGQLGLSLAMPALHTVQLGGLTASRQVLLWSVVAPFGAMLVTGPRAALGWLAAFLGLVVVAAVLDPPGAAPVIPEFFAAFNLLGPALLLFAATRFFVGQNGALLDGLRRARAAAEDAAAAKNLFLANVSHEIRTPLNAVVGMSALLRSTELTPEQREYAETVEQGADALLAVIDDVLDFAKMEAGRLELERVPVDLHGGIESALALVAARAAEKGLDLAYVVEPEVPAAVLGDPKRMRQILLNLLSNAVKFTERGEVTVTLGMFGGDLHLRVRDTGIGIPPELMSRLFRSFSQVDASTARRFGGSGLGLAISRGLAELMGGRLWAESVPGAGSTFHCTLPAVPAVLPAPPAGAVAPRALAGSRVLVVDDNATNRRLLQYQLAKWEMPAGVFATAEEALADVRAGTRYDVALLDHRMPGADGLDLARALRAELGERCCPLVLLSSVLHRDEQAAECRAAGIATVLTKPIRPSALLDVLAGALGVREAAQPAAPAFPGEGLADRAPLRVLLAEDNPTNRLLALRVLARMGYDADTAADGAEAVAAVRAAQPPYDVVLMDVQMPGTDGLAATRALRAALGPGRPYVVAVTANATPEDRAACLRAGMDDYVAKPIRPERLAAALERAHAVLAAAPGPPAPAAVDPAALERLAELVGGADEVAELVEVFLADTPGLLDELDDAAAAGDPDRVRRAAHSLASTAATVGAHGLAAAAREVERAAAAGSVPEVGPVRRAFAPVARELRASSAVEPVGGAGGGADGGG